MKKILFCIAFVSVGLSLNAQEFKIGLSGGYNSTWILNKNVSDAGSVIDYESSGGGSFGLKAQYYFNEKIGVELGVLSSGHNQKFLLADGDIEATTKLRYIDIPILFRYGGGSGFYFEVGPQIGLLSSAEDEWDDETYDVKKSLNGTNLALVLGLGADFSVSDNLVLTAGVRFGYGISDVTKEYDSIADLISDGDNISIPTAGAHFSD